MSNNTSTVMAITSNKNSMLIHPCDLITSPEGSNCGLIKYQKGAIGVIATTPVRNPILNFYSLDDKSKCDSIKTTGRSSQGGSIGTILDVKDLPKDKKGPIPELIFNDIRSRVLTDKEQNIMQLIKAKIDQLSK